MLRSAASKVMWVGRATVFMVGLAVILAVVFGVASTALGANGNPWILGRANVATAVTSLGGAAGVDGPMLKITNNDAGTNDTALDLRVQSGEAPMTVNSGARVTDLNSDQLDGKDQSAFADVNELDGDITISRSGPLPVEGTFTSDGGTLVILAFGSGRRGGGVDEPFGRIAMEYRIDGRLHGRIASGFDETSSNTSQVFVSTPDVVEGLPAGTHTLRLEAEYDDDCNTVDETTSTVCTTTNSHDEFGVTVVELSD